MIKQRIQQLIAVGGNCVNLGRTMAARHPDLHSHIMGMTGFLDHKNPKFNERVWCVMNDITGPVIDATGKPARFDSIFTGYVMCERVAENARKNAKKQQQLNHTRSQTRQARDQHIEHCLTLAQRVGSNDLEVGRHIDKHVRYWKTGGGKALYGDDAVAGVDYVVCPVTGLRKAMIRSNYVTSVLGITMEQYAAIVGPDFVYVAHGHKSKIVESLKEIDTDTGLTRHQKSQLGRTETMNVVNPDTGLTPNQIIGIRTRETHMSNIDELGRNGYSQLAAKRKETYCENGKTVEQNAVEKHSATLAKRGVSRLFGASSASKTRLRPILEWLNDKSIEYHFDKTEYWLNDPDTKNKYFYDLTIPRFGVIIEYQSNAWHPDPRLDDADWDSWKPPRGKAVSAEYKLQYDYHKAKVAFDANGFRTFFVWENTSAQDVEDILCMLRTHDMRSGLQMAGKISTV